MENKAHALAAGMFTLLLGAALIAVVMWFNRSETQAAFYTLYTTGSVTGLKPDAPVRFRGVDVGRVTSIRLEPGGTGRIQLEIGVQADTPVTAGTYAQLGYQGITGIAYVQLSDDGKPGDAAAAGGARPAQIRMKPSLLDEGEALFAVVSDVATKLGRLLDGDNQEKMRTTLAGMDALAQRAGSVAKRIEPALDSLPVLLAESKSLAIDARSSLKRMEQFADNADRLVANTSQLALKLDQRMDTLDQVAVTAREAGAMVRTLSEESVPRVNGLIDDLSRETRAMNRSVERVVNTVVEQPQGFVFGVPAPRPGPGEPGFNGGK